MSEESKSSIADGGGCPNGPDEYGNWPCDPKGYFGVAECQVCGRIATFREIARPASDAEYAERALQRGMEEGETEEIRAWCALNLAGLKESTEIMREAAEIEESG